MIQEAGLSLGSNLDDRMAALSLARDRIVTIPGVTLVAQAPVYETEPVGVKEQYRHLLFLNTVLVVASALSAHELFDQLREIEIQMGRQRSLDQNAPREIDIDVIFFGAQRIVSGGLVIPHPRWRERRFVVQPLSDVRPDLVLPGETLTVRQVLDTLPATDGVTLLTPHW